MLPMNSGLQKTGVRYYWYVSYFKDEKFFKFKNILSLIIILKAQKPLKNRKTQKTNNGQSCK